MKKLTIAAVVAAMSLVGCKTTTSYIDAADTTTNVVAALSYADFSKAANEMADDIISNKLMTHPQADVGGRYIIYVSGIENDTMQRLDTDQLTKSLRVKLLQSGKFLVTTAFGEDDATKKMRDLKNSKMVKQASVKGDNQVLAPDFSLSGKILQRDSTLDNGDTRIEYYFQMSLTNIENGLAYWEGERVVGKVADGSSVSW
ncbi:penicillin-binding protein activator LpoB [Vibrio parahaemolyticus]|uniref:penicillin-binding protein activator LpoB n=1 Tax=Vibrio TaxID=662 RepID=UPI0002B6FE36|nr:MULTISPECIES: penicillin-binding protein activator LpoB [Vibrio]ELX7503667.1 penicillin-binding protein activator LpoB [Vibrio fluvialis]EGQ9818377.1 penicillin-binding protein activator LpoB [Vibrio parahaemolyticus]EGR3001944.1 penicillin-binding protein activator LpoB [Vibrio parahaemolyticus]EHH2534607.1 penicillin-binding protein activator LpoB [Vibrio parahaemolyticus]EHR0228349.1 penicillin-binding protein activator LpoB [Vibrio parahaemolyticus]